MSDTTTLSVERAQRAAGWWASTAAFASVSALWLAILILYRETFVEIVQVWSHSDTFAHGFLIVPLSAWLIWRQRAAFRDPAARPSLALASLLALTGLLWAVSTVASINATRQIAAVAMLVIAPLALIGWRSGRMLLFPLAYLLFAVPLGESLVPQLMDFTARFAVGALQVTGVPVFKEGFFISTPGGEFEVARACSGIRYLLATLAIGSVYAYMAIERPWKRAAFIVLCIVVPIVANGIRAYGIILLASLTSVDRAADVDHLIYGWLFFGVVLFLLFLLGRRLADVDRNGPAPPAPDARMVTPVWLFALSAAALTATLGAAQAVPRMIGEGPAQRAWLLESLPPLSGTWRGPVGQPTTWQPQFEGANQVLTSTYTNGVRDFDVALISYTLQTQGKELVNARNQPFDSPRWLKLNEGGRQIHLPRGQTLSFRQAMIRSSSANRMAWSAYIVDGQVSDSAIRVKLEQALDRLLGRPSRSAALLISTEVDEWNEPLDADLQGLLVSYLPPVIRCIESGDASVGACPP
jgi:exosortase A